MLLLMFGPAVLGLVAIVVAIRLFSDPEGQTTNTTTRKVMGVLCLVLALGIGACYGVLFSGSGF